jgi:hypothetical protein
MLLALSRLYIAYSLAQSCTNTLQLRHLVQPFKAGDRFADHARPIGEVMSQLTIALTELANFKMANPDFTTTRFDNSALNGYVAAGRESGVGRIQDARARWT